MEMNRYLIAALYVMAGCVVTIPLKVEDNFLPSEREGCRLVITNTVKVVSAYLEKKAIDYTPCGLFTDICFTPEVNCYTEFSYFWKIVSYPFGNDCSQSNPIRAPGNN